MWHIYSLIDHCKSVSKEIEPGKWAPCRPVTYWEFKRIKWAWMVLTCQADALVWPGKQ